MPLGHTAADHVRGEAVRAFVERDVGPRNLHSEVPLLGDIVLAYEDAYFRDLAYFPRGMTPRDGQRAIWPALFGRNPGRYLLLTGKKLSAQEASHGAVSTRCWRRTGCSTARGSWLAYTPISSAPSSTS
jgi:hypothetical protein